MSAKLEIVHEAERQRQHVRIKLPVVVEIAGRAFTTDNWSVGGFRLVGMAKGDMPQRRSFPATLKFPFDGYEFSLSLTAEVRYRDDESGALGCRFNDLTRDQIAILVQVVNAYMAGDMVSAGTLLSVVRRENFGAPRNAKLIEHRPGFARRVVRATGRGVRLCVTLAVVAGLAAFLASTLYQRVFVVEASAAVVDAPIIVMRSPAPGLFIPMRRVGELAPEGEPIGSLELVGGGSINLDSPCTCRVIERVRLPREFAAPGEPVMTLLPADARVTITAQVPMADARRLVIGHAAVIRFPDQSEARGRVRDVRNAVSLTVDRAAPMRYVPAEPRAYAEVVIEPEVPIGLDRLGAAAQVVVDTFQRPGWLDQPFAAAMATQIVDETQRMIDWVRREVLVRHADSAHAGTGAAIPQQENAR